MIITPQENRDTPFNSRPHEEADLYGFFRLLVRLFFQLAASRGGRPYALPDFLPVPLLSTRGLTRRPTAIFHSFFVKNVIYYDILYITCFRFTLGIIDKPLFVNFDSLISVRTLDIFMFSPYSH